LVQTVGNRREGGLEEESFVESLRRFLREVEEDFVESLKKSKV
jgi:hypothetical protein